MIIRKRKKKDLELSDKCKITEEHYKIGLQKHNMRSVLSIEN